MLEFLCPCGITRDFRVLSLGIVYMSEGFSVFFKFNFFLFILFNMQQDFFQSNEFSRSPFQYLDNLFFKSDDRKALRTALYNTGVLVLVAILVGVGISVYFILQAFLKPLLWAILIGTCLHPFKRHLTNSVRGWIDKLNYSNTPIIVGTITLPLMLANNMMENLSKKFFKHAKFIISFTIGFPTVYAFYYFGNIMKALKFFESVFFALSDTLVIFSTYWVSENILFLVF